MTQSTEKSEEEERLHEHCECQLHLTPETSHGPCLSQNLDPDPDPDPDPRQERGEKPDDPDFTDSESDSEGEPTKGSHHKIMIKGTEIVPSFAPHLLTQNELVRIGQSLGSVSLPPQQHPYSPKHQELVWAGSSMGTMHYGQVQPPMQTVPIYSLGSYGLSGSRANGIHKAPSLMSKTRMGSMFGSQTVSESGTDMFAFCRICQMHGDEQNPLISPCRCAGSLRYIHSSCLKKWIRISHRRCKKNPPRCELCHYQFNRHKRFKFSQWRWPRVRRRDKVLHIIFLLNLIIMIGCAIATVMCFLSDRGSVVKFPKEKVKLTTEEVITLTCGVMFFVAFFIAMTVEIKARHTLYKLFRRFITHNTEWTVDQYDPSKDPMFSKRCPASVV